MQLSLASTMPLMLNQIIAMFLMMGVGAICFKAGFITKDGSKVFTNLACYVSTPAVVLRALASKFDPEVAANVAWVVGVTCILMVVCIVCARLAYGSNGNRAAQVGIIVSNMGFVGIPLVEGVIGEEYVIYISATIAAQTVFIWTYCVWMYTRDRSTVSVKKVFTNPVIISVIVGFAMFFLSYEPQGVVKVFVDGMANLNTGLGMLIVGIFLAQSDLRALLRTRSIYKASALRLLVTAGIAALILAVTPMPQACKAVLLIAFSCPCGAMSSMMPQLFDGDYRFGAGLVTISTLLSIVTMPALLSAGLMLF